MRKNFRLKQKQRKKSFKDIENAKPATERKYPRFYCTICKMKTWTFHEHDGLNTSSTRKNARIKEDITTIFNKK